MRCWVLGVPAGLGLAGLASAQEQDSAPRSEAAAPPATDLPATAEPAEPLELSAHHRALIADAARTDDDEGLRFLLQLIRAQAGVTDQMVLDAVIDVAPQKRALARDSLGMPEPSMLAQAGVAPPPRDPESGAAPEDDESAPADGQSGARARWSGQATLGLDIDVTETTDTELDVTLSARRSNPLWALEIQLEYSRELKKDIETENEFFGSLRSEWETDSHWTRYAYTEFEADEFSSYEVDWWVAGGLGYRWLERENLNFVTRGGVGARHLNPVVGELSTGLGFDASAELHWQVRPWLLFRSTTLLQASEQGQADQRFRLSSNFSDDWGIQISYRFKYDFDPVEGFAADKTELDLSIVRNF